MNKVELLKIAKPILFSAEMVQAILENRKTVTRRAIKPRYKDDEYGFQVITNKGTGERWIEKTDDDEGSFDSPRYVKPPYNVGDILYVRETWYYEEHMHDLAAEEPNLPSGRYSHRYIFKASSPDYLVDFGVGANGWKPSIHMPKEAARIFLKVMDVRVERLQDITEEQAEKEGIQGYSKDGNLYKYAASLDWWNEYHRKYISKINSGTAWQNMPRNPWVAFMYLWDSTIKKQDIDKYLWEANPWVWVIEFEKVEVSE